MRGLLCMLAACAFVPGAAAAQTLADYDYENLTFRGIGVDYGYVWPNKVESTALYSVRLDLGYLGPGLRIAPTLSYWSSTMKDSELELFAERLEQLPALRDRGVDLSADDLGVVTWSDFAIGVDAQLVWTTPLDVMTFLGAGVAVHAMNGRGTAIDETFVEDLLDSTAPSFSLSAGAEYQLVQRLRIYGEARFNIQSDIRYPALRAGLALMLPPRPGTGAGQ